MIELHKKTAAWAVTATSTIMFAAMVLLAPQLASAAQKTKLASIVLAAFSSLGLYKTTNGLLLWVFGKLRLVRRLLLGGAFLEGTWVGHYQNGGLDRFTIEFIDQSSGETRVEGREFDEKLKTRASWRSDASFVDVRNSRLIYVYACDVYDKNYQQNGIGDFGIVRSPAGDKLDGYAVDMVDGKKDRNTEFKISSCRVNDDEALGKARELFGIK